MVQTTDANDPKLLRDIATGGHYWPALQRGRVFSVPNGSKFIVHETPRSKKVIGRGEVKDGWIVTVSGKQYDHMNKAVLACVGHEENAFRVVEFFIDGKWITAEDLRSQPAGASRFDEQYRLDTCIDYVRKNAEKQGHPEMLEPPLLYRTAARMALKTFYPGAWEELQASERAGKAAS